MGNFYSKGSLFLLIILVGSVFMFNGCSPRSHIKHAKIGEDEDQAPEMTELPMPPPSLIEEKPTAIPTAVATQVKTQAMTQAMTQAPTQAPTPVPTATLAPTAEPEKSLSVKKGDTLWDISSERDVYGNAFLWPLLFKANQDKILDPDLIYPKQTLKLGAKFDQTAIEKAQKNAKVTPPYKPHRKPRKELPVTY